MTKIDFKKTLPAYKAKRNKLAFVEVPPLQYLMVDGGGGPGSQAYQEALEALYPLAYGLKFLSKLELGKDYVVPPLESLWWADDMTTFTTNRDKTAWLWTAMLMLPDWLDQAHLDAAIEKVQAKKAVPTALHLVRLELLIEDTCAQTLHLGSYDNEGPILQEMHEVFIPEAGYVMTGKHHEIYFNDFRKIAPEKLRTILRQPVV